MNLFRDTYCALNGNAPYPVEGKYTTLYVKITDACNAKCPFCTFANKDKTFYFNVARFKDALSLLSKHATITKVSFTGGEPSLVRGLIDKCVDIVKTIDKNIFTVVNTNGSNILGLDNVKGLDNIALSRHHFDDDKNSGIFGTESVPTSKTLWSVASEKIHLSCTMMKGKIWNYKSISDYLEWANGIGIRDVGFVSLMPVNDFCRKYFVEFPDDKFFDERLVKNKVWNNGDICRCANYLFLPKRGAKVVKLYTRFRCQHTADSKSSLTFDGWDLRTNFNGKIIKEKDMENTVEETIKKQLDNSGFDYAVAIATKAEVEAGAACGQLAIINE